MNYSPEWTNKLEFYNGLTKELDWDGIVRGHRLDDPSNKQAKNLIILNKPIWVEIHEMIGIYPLRKIKAISKYDVFFEGVYRPISYSTNMGCIHGWEYTIDGHTLDLTSNSKQDNNQEKLLDFIKVYSDGFYEPVPKGILKIPTII